MSVIMDISKIMMETVKNVLFLVKTVLVLLLAPVVKLMTLISNKKLMRAMALYLVSVKKVIHT